MLNRKFLSGAILIAAVCLTACSKGGNEVSETVSETISEAVTAAAETASTASETTAETTTTTEATAAEEIIDTSGVDYIKEALQAEFDEDISFDEDVSVVSLYTADLNGDGVEELFVNYTLGVGMNGIVYVYDVSDGVNKLYEISARIWDGDAKMYKDENETAHFILQANYTGAAWQENFAYFDIAYDSIKMPFYVDIHGWFDHGAHMFDHNIYKNCEVVSYKDESRGWRNFDPKKAELIGTYDVRDILKALKEGESNEVSEIVQKEVFDGLTYVSDVEEIYTGSIRDFEDFDSFWQEAAPKLAEEYNK